MRSLLLFRHGKSDWSGEGAEDRERPLAKRGQKAARAMGRFLEKALQVPAAAITSPAARARETLQIAQEAGGWTCPVRVSDALYEASPAAVLEVVRGEPDTTETLLLVGHEPAWSDLASRLIGGGSLDVPTGAILKIAFEAESWKAVDFGGGQLSWLVVPRLFTDGEIKL